MADQEACIDNSVLDDSSVDDNRLDNSVRLAVHRVVAVLDIENMAQALASIEVANLGLKI